MHALSNLFLILLIDDFLSNALLRELKNDTTFLIETKSYPQHDTKKHKIFWYHFEGNVIKFNCELKIRPDHNHNK